MIGCCGALMRLIGDLLKERPEQLAMPVLAPNHIAKLELPIWSIPRLQQLLKDPVEDLCPVAQRLIASVGDKQKNKQGKCDEQYYR